jgi:hypothetical protein
MRYSLSKLVDLMMQGLIIVGIILVILFFIGGAVSIAVEMYVKHGKYFFVGLLGVLLCPIILALIGVANEKYGFVRF